MKARYLPAAFLFAALGLGGGIPTAQAGDLHRTTAVNAIVGFGTPVGMGGLEIIQRLADNVELTAGVGEGMSAAEAHNGSTLQWAVMPRLRLGESWRNGLTLGAGMSGGNFGKIPFTFCDEHCDPEPSSYPVHYVLWANFEIGGEHWLRGGLAIRYFAGYAHGWKTDSPSSTLDVPYFGSGIGYAF